ncbi:RecQ family ATP-dependent DNA helicase [Nakamurella deserti]|uniref:RecQ family ATP-dependent DNA helicase n=1 Tax=Nakamurella deserti TaxID=2164074 RepID=UPI000DBE06CE|nr:RecQ family ATP-dependent DNA helicase [Nakamurella deserti]
MTTPLAPGCASTVDDTPVSAQVSRELTETAATVFGWDELRPDQLRAMEQLMAGRDVLAVLPTGAGKSAIYQVPAVLIDGLTVVVSPLLALQHDQIEGLAASSAPAAVAINSAQRVAERDAAWSAVRDGSAKYLFVSPEQLARDDVTDALATLGVGLLVVDEAHCVSAWGHDFRPEYLRLGGVVERLGRPRVVALTASAAPPVRDDIEARLGLRDPCRVVAGFDRPELRLTVDRTADDDRKRLAVVERVRELAAGRPHRGLVYTASRRDTEYYAAELTVHGLSAAAYHAGLRATQRRRVHEDFLAGKIDIVVATSAFGMGIDVPDVRFVVHAAVPESLDTYYQQIGRAGRDGDPAEVDLWYRPEDLHLQTFLTASRLPEDAIREIAGVLRGSATPVTPTELGRRIDAGPARRTRALNLLEQVGAVASDGTAVDWIDPDLDTRTALERCREAADAHQQLIRSRVEMMRGFAETTGCRRQFLLGYFGEQLTEPCGNCDTCAAGTACRHPDADGPTAVNSPVRHPRWGHGVVMSVEPDRLTVLFDDVGYRTLDAEAVRTHGLLIADDGVTGHRNAA